MNEQLASVFRYYPSTIMDTKPERPWRFGPWLWATQGHVLVALKDDGSDADNTPDKMRKAESYLTDASLLLRRPVSLSDLRTFAGPVVPDSVPCARCSGSGRSDDGDVVGCEHCGQNTRVECHSCGGDGVGWLESRYGRIGGTPVNLALVAFALSIVPQDTDADIGFVKSVARPQYQALVIIGASWRVAVMSLSESVLLDGSEFFPIEAIEEPVTVGAVDPHDGLTPPAPAREKESHV